MRNLLMVASFHITWWKFILGQAPKFWLHSVLFQIEAARLVLEAICSQLSF